MRPSCVSIQATAAAKAADYVICVVDNARDGGGEGHDRYTIGLSPPQLALANAVIRANANTVLVLVNGGLISIDDLTQTAPAILEVCHLICFVLFCISEFCLRARARARVCVCVCVCRRRTLFSYSSTITHAGMFIYALQAWMPGVHGGAAVAATVFGDNNPGGKMPVTMYHSSYVNVTDFLSMSMVNRSYRFVACACLDMHA